MGRAVTAIEGQLAFDGGEHPRRDPGVELHPTLRGGHDIALEELAHGLEELRGGRLAMQVGQCRTAVRR